MLRYGLLLSLLALLTGCATTPPDTHDADIQAIKTTETAWAKDAAAKDVDKFVSYYTDDASILLPNAPIITGKESIKSALKPLMGDPNFSLTFASTKQDVAKSGDLGYTIGGYTMTMSGGKDKGPITEKGKYATVFRKQADGSWKAVADMLNSDMMSPPEAPSK
jgi:ketosteroid isomerase-like protein